MGNFSKKSGSLPHISQKQRILRLESSVEQLVHSLNTDRRSILRLTDAIVSLSGALQVLQNKKLVTNEEIKQAIEASVAKASAGESGSRIDSGESISGVSDTKSPGNSERVSSN